MKQTWHILGAGSIGSLFACALRDAGIPVCLMQRHKIKLGQEKQLRIDRGKITSSYTLPISWNGELGSIANLLICTKAYDVESAFAQVAHRLSHTTNVVIMVNGMGYMDALTERCPDIRFTLGTTTEGVFRIADGHFCHAGRGVTHMGQLTTSTRPGWFQPWSELYLNPQWEPNIQQSLWQKLAVNCAINPLTAVQRCKNGVLAERVDLSEKVNSLCTEISRLSLAAGYEDTATNIHAMVATVIAKTAKNSSSMLQDVLAGRPTENNYISGYLVRMAQQLGVEVPCNTNLFERMKALDQTLA